MRQFVLAGNVAYGAGGVNPVTNLSEGAVAFTYLNDGVETLVSTGTENFGRFNLAVGRGNDHGGAIILPMFRYHFSYTKSEYQAGTAFHATLEIPSDRMLPFSVFTIIVVKNGIQFNERNKWTASVPGGVSPSTDTIATALANHLQNNKVGHGLEVTVFGSTITFDGEDYRDYTILCADALTGVEVTMVHASKPINDARMIQDMYEKAWAGKGYNNTFIAPNMLMYPHLRLGSWESIDPDNEGFTVYTFRFAEPREMKTRDEVVHQIIQLVLPTGASAISTIDTILEGLADEGGYSGKNLC